MSVVGECRAAAEWSAAACAKMRRAMTWAERIRRLAMLACAVALALALAPAAAGATAPLGALTALPSPFGCYLTTAGSGCSAAPDLDSVKDVALSPSANVLYVLSSAISPTTDTTLSAYQVDPSNGHLGARVSCLQYIVISDGCSGSGGIFGGGRMVVGPDGRGLYVVTYDGSTGGLSAFGTDPATGAITGLTSCFTESGVSCAPGDLSFTAYRKGYALALPRNVAVSPDGRTVYTASGGNRGGLAAFARDTSSGALTTELNCLTGLSGPGTETSCPVDVGVEDASSVAASNVAIYVGSDHDSGDHGSVVAFARDSAAGTIQSRIGCLQQSGGGVPSCNAAFGGGLVAPEQLTLSPGSGMLYAASTNSLGSLGELASIRVAANGAPSSPLAGCLMSTFSGDSCSVVPGVRGAAKLAVSADGRRLYAVDDLDNRVAAFALDPVSGAAQAPPLSCAGSGAATGCPAASNGAALQTLDTVAIGPGGSVLYTGAHGGGLALFGIEVPPSCAARSASTTAGAAVTIPLACSDPNGDALTLAIAGGPAHGTLGAVQQAGGGTVVYTPAAGFAGADSFAYTASDGTASAPAATVNVGVSPAAPPGSETGKPPVLSAVKLAPAKFRAVARRKMKRPPVGATLTYKLSGAATTTLTLQRAGSGRRQGRRCVAQTKRNRAAKRCTRWVGLRGSARHASGAGSQRVRFSGLWGGKPLAPGSYRLTLVAADGAGRRSAPATVAFAIVR